MDESTIMDAHVRISIYGPADRRLPPRRSIIITTSPLAHPDFHRDDELLRLHVGPLPRTLPPHVPDIHIHIRKNRNEERRTHSSSPSHTHISTSSHTHTRATLLLKRRTTGPVRVSK
eukprot:GHVU01053487.1.p4 GENE.GHVU01053487.1~~GHVU01053487.1.p4  ORF type:complete len:117 (+),score=14.54 GHVU01053487.1:152-502(+)